MSANLRRVLFIAGPMLAVGIIAGSIFAWTYQPKADAKGCGDSTVATHQVTIRNSQVSPQITDGNLCDKITFTNKDNVTREIAFGPHEHHVAYDGVAERVLGKNQSFTLTMNKAGMFHFHDHAHDEVMGYFNVAK